jgi:hypothetical protein
MVATYAFLSGMMGVLGIFFAHLAGRSGAQVQKRTEKRIRFYGWMIRAAGCEMVPVLYPLGKMNFVIWSLAVAAFVLGWWGVARTKPDEDLSKEMFRE